MEISKEELQKILDDHAAWLRNESTGKYAKLQDKYLMNVDLSGADLSFADLEGARFCNAKLNGVKFTHSKLRFANFSDADLSGADLAFADLRGATFSGANLQGVDFSGTDLMFADFNGANVDNVKISDMTSGFAPLCPLEGTFIAYKKVEDKIVVLEIPEDARRNSGTSYICRCDKAKILRIENFDGTIATENSVGGYTVGEIKIDKNFEADRFNWRGLGIIFFISRDMAVNFA
ncbi:MAG: pentapeptide repeat-containing protein [Selenomonadaceae bacterium]|nr:pentapeptide repeat-containing protein [Selenomonadaceae bacterium]